MMCQKIARVGWSGFGIATDGIHPTHFRSLMAIPPKSHPKEYWEVYCKTAALGRGGGEVYEFCASLSIIIRIHPIPLHHQQKEEKEKFMKSSHEVTAPAMTVWQGQGSIHEIERSNDITFNVIGIMVNDDIASADWRSQFWKQPRWVIKPSSGSLLDLRDPFFFSSTLWLVRSSPAAAWGDITCSAIPAPTW